MYPRLRDVLFPPGRCTTKSPSYILNLTQSQLSRNGYRTIDCVVRWWCSNFNPKPPPIFFDLFVIVACGYFPSSSCDEAAVPELPEPTTDRDEIRVKIGWRMATNLIPWDFSFVLVSLANGTNLDRIATGRADAVEVEEDVVVFYMQSKQRHHVRRNPLFRYPKDFFGRDKL